MPEVSYLVGYPARVDSRWIIWLPDGAAMRWEHDGWAQQWHAERLVAGVEEALGRWDDDPRQAARRLDTLLRVASPRAVVSLENVYRGRRRSLAGMLGTDVDALIDDYGRHA